MALQDQSSYLRKMLGDTLGFIVFAVLVAAYFPVFIVYFITSAICMGLATMIWGENLSESTNSLRWIFPAIPTAVLVLGGIGWTAFLLSALANGISK